MPRPWRFVLGGYLLLLAATTAFVYVAERTTLLGQGDGLSGMWLILLASPLSFLADAVVGDTIDGLVLFPLVGLLQAAIVLLVVRAYFAARTLP